MKIGPLWLLVVLVVGFAYWAEAQHPRKVARIGYLSPQSGPSQTLPAFKEGLRALGWVEGQQIEIVYRYAGGDVVKLSEFATELVRLKVDVIVAGSGNGAAVRAKRVTTTIPIVMVGTIDPVSNGLVTSLARAGSNVTGLTGEVTREQAGKNLELLKDAVPNISRVAVLRNPNISAHIAYSKEAESAAKALGVAVQFAEMQARTDKDLEQALGAVIGVRANALLVTPNPFFVDHRRQIIDFAARHKLPAIYFSAVFVVDGGQMSYSPSGQDMWRRAAVYVDKILKGTNPADLPVEQPKKFDLMINLKTAKQIGLTIPPNLLARADRVIR
jgi:putative ABC transport system substrate-binding protein